MLYFSRWKIIAIILTVLAGVVAASPNFLSKETLASLPEFMPKKPLPLGLDLQGGAHLLLAMDQDEIRKDWLAGLRDSVRQSLRENRVGPKALGVQGGGITLTLANAEDTAKMKTELAKLAQPVGSALLGSSNMDLEVIDGTAPFSLLVRPTEVGMRERLVHAASASIETINRRINALGTSESTVVKQGVDRILIQFPGLSDTTELKKLIGETAKLSFHQVHPSESAADAKLSSVPPGYKIYPSDVPEEGEYLLMESPVVQGEDLSNAQQGFDGRTNEAVINFMFNQRGAVKFGQFTRENVGRPFAIVLDNKVLSAPVIREAIMGGSGQISGNFTVKDANTLAVQLRSGALPTKLTIVEERTVGPSLGQDSIEAGTDAGLIGLGLVLLMTVIVYGTFGVYAVIGLLVHAVLILALMTAIGTTLTLPGIAGFVLTIAMAVDANVLIYERIREELRTGKSTISAIDAGFSRAIVTIADSQLTTLVAAVIMFWLGSGPIRGFAVTLSLGILTSIFAAVTVTRLLVAMWLANAKTKSKTLNVPL